MRHRVWLFIWGALILAPGVSIPQWSRIPGPDIRIPLSTSAVATRGDTIFVGTYRGTIFRSTNGGSDWTKADSGISDLYWTQSLLVMGDTVFAGAENGIYRSTNAGAYWTFSKQGFPAEYNWLDVETLLPVGDDLLSGSEAGVYRSTDHGESWTSSSAGLPADTPVLELVSLNGTLFIASLRGVFKSTDNGSNWTASHAGFDTTFPYLYRTYALFAWGNELFAGTSDRGLYRSTNGGDYWTHISSPEFINGNGFYFPIYSVTGMNGVLYVGTQDGGILRSSDDGATWNPFNNGLPEFSYIQSFGEMSSKILAAEFHGLYVRDLPDTAWKPLLTEFSGSVDARVIGTSPVNLYIYASSMYYNGNIGGVYLTSNQGAQWQHDSLLTSKSVYKILSFGDSLYGLGSELLFSPDGGSTWKSYGSAVQDPNTLVKREDTLFAGSGFAYWQQGEQGNIYYSTNNGETWDLRWSGDTAIFALEKLGGYLFAGGPHGVFRSFNNGLTWNSMSVGLPLNAHITGLSAAGGDLLTWVGGMYRSTDNAESWLPVTLPDVGTSYTTNDLLKAEDQLFAATNQGVFLSTDYGADWFSFTDGLSEKGGLVNSLANRTDDLYAGTGDGVWRRVIGAQTLASINLAVKDGWNLSSIPLIPLSYKKTVLFPGALSEAYGYGTSYVNYDALRNGLGYWLKFAGSSIIPMTGVKKQVDTVEVKNSWNLVGSISSPIAVSMIESVPPGIVLSPIYAYSAGGTYVVADTIFPGKGYWVNSTQQGKLVFSSSGNASSKNRIRISPIAELPPAPPGDIGLSSGIPGAVTLNQNYPNPFNPVTLINYFIPSRQYVSLKIFDALGREVRTLVDGIQDEGDKTVRVDASAIASGIYFYKLVTRELSVTKKMVILR